MMTRNDPSKLVQSDLFKVMQRDIVFQKHELVLLKLGICFSRTYVRKGKTMLRKHSGYVKAKQFNRAKNAVRTLKTYLSNVVRDVEGMQIVPRNTRDIGLLSQLQNYIDNYMERNRLAGTRGDGPCAILAAVGFNLRKLMRGLKRLFLSISGIGGLCGTAVRGIVRSNQVCASFQMANDSTVPCFKDDNIMHKRTFCIIDYIDSTMGERREECI